MRKTAQRFLGVSLAWILCSCSTLAPHDNFKEHMQSNVGGSIDEPSEAGVASRKYLLSSKSLPNGNVENEYQFVRSCRYFFEFVPESKVIVGWRFEGSEKDCVIVP